MGRFDDIFASFGGDRPGSAGGGGRFDDVFSQFPEEAPTVASRAAKVGRAALDVVGAPKRAVDVAANYYGPGGNEVLSEGLTPVVPTTGELVKEAVLPDEDAKTSYGKSIAREVLGFATDLGTDPLTYAGFGAGVPGKVAGAAFTGMMAHGAVQAGQSAYEEMLKDGFSPEVAATLTRALLEGGGAALGARHLVGGHAAPGPEVVPERGTIVPEVGTPREAPFVAAEQPFAIPADRPFENYPFEAPPAAPVFQPEAPPVDVLAERDFLRPDMTAATNAEQARLAREYVSGNSTVPGLGDVMAPAALPRLGEALPPMDGRPGAEAVSFSPRAAEVAAEQGVRVEPQTATSPEILQRDSQEAARMAKKLTGFAEPELRRRLDFYQKVGFPESLRAIREEIGRRQAETGPVTPEGQPLPASTWDQLTAKEQADVATTMGLGFSKGSINKLTVEEARAMIPRRPAPPAGETPPSAAAPAPVEPPAGPQPPAAAGAPIEERRRDVIVDRRETAAPVNLERRVAERRARILEEDPTISESHAERIARAEDEARTDPLTGLENARAFEEALKTHAGPVVSMDLGGLGYVNDHLGGHPAGDAFLKAAADALREEQGVRTFRAGEKADEFALLADTPEAAEAAAKSVQERFSNAQFTGLRDGQPVRFTGGRIDYGVGVEGSTAAERFKHGDAELYTSRERAVDEGLRPGVKGSRPVGLREVPGPGELPDSPRTPQGPLEPQKFAAAEAPAKGAPVTADHVRAAFPTAKIEPTDQGFRVSMPHGREIRVDTHGEIEYDPAAFHAGHPEAAPGDKPAGSYQRIGREAVIALAKSADQSIVHHEAFHAAMDLALSPKERESVLRHYKDEEAAADAYSKWNPREKTNSFFGKIRDFFRNVYRSFKPSWESSFENVRSGKAFDREGAAPAAEPKYATAPKMPPSAERKLAPIPDRPEAIKETPADRSESISVADESRSDALVRYLQDKLIRVKRTQEGLEKAGRSVSEKHDIYGQMSALDSRVSEMLKQSERQYADPVVKSLTRNGLTLDQLDDYMLAKHAEQGNRVANERGGPEDGGIGITNEKAREILDKVESEGKTFQYEAAAKTVRDALSEARKIMVESGLESADEIRRWEETFGPDYVPVRSFETEDINNALQRQDEAGRLGGRGRFDIAGHESKFRGARDTKADSPVSFALAQLQRTIVRAEKNKIRQNLAGLVEKHPDPTFWEIDKKHESIVGSENGRFIKEQNHKAISEDLEYKVDGKRHRIWVKDPLLQRALKDMSAGETGKWVQKVGTLTRRFSQLVTSWNPSFIFTNFARDIQAATANVTAEHGTKVAASVVKGVPDALKEMYTYAKDPAKASKLAREFKEDGGSVGWYQVARPEEFQKALEAKVDAAGPGALRASKRAIQAMGEWVQTANGSVENATRFATYKALREAGVSRAKAATAARNVTLDFTKKGEASPTINALYAFFNANVQGMKRMKEIVVDSPRGRAVAASVVAMGLVNDLYNRANAGDANDDGTNDYDDIPEFVKQKNFVFMRGPGKKPLLFPMPYGFNVLHTLGRQVGAGASGAVKPIAMAGNVLGAASNAFNPLGGEAGFVQAITPTFLDPFVQHATNETWSGRPLKPTAFPGAPQKPESEMFFKNVSPTAKAVAQWLNKASGGDSVTPGYVSVSPEVLAHYADAANNYLTGGLGKAALQGAEAVEEVSQGKAPSLRNLPIANRFAYEASPGQAGQKFRANVDELETLWGRYKTYREERNSEGLRSIPAALLKAKKSLDSIDNRIRQMRKVLKARPDLEVQIDQLQARGNKIVADAKRSAGA